MAEMDIKNTGKRAIFPTGKQTSFIETVVLSSRLSKTELASAVNVHPRTFSDWVREKYSIPVSAVKKLCEISDLPYPSGIVEQEKYWYAKKGAAIGGRMRYKKYGGIATDPEYRKERWLEWWNREGKYKSKVIGKTKEFNMPKKSKLLAEFFGIMLGDGGLTEYQCKISLNSEADALYSLYIEDIFYRLFKFKLKKHSSQNSKELLLYASRKALCDFLFKEGLKKGHKINQKVDIPLWIKQNKEYLKACIRGLFDTDGCVFHEVHTIGEKRYAYNRLNFVSASPSLIQSVFTMLKDLNLDPVVRRNGLAVQVENKSKIWQYFKTIGTSNPKHLDRWKMLLGQGIDKTKEE